MNSGAVNVNKSDATKRQQRKPKAQSDLQKKLRGQAGVVNNAAGAAAKPTAAERRSAAAASTRATPPPQPGGGGSVGGAGGSGTPGPSVGATAPGPGLGPSVGGTLPPAAPAVPPPLAADAPVPMRLKRVLDLLRSNRDTFTFADLKAKLNMDLSQDTELLEHLQSHTQVRAWRVVQAGLWVPASGGRGLEGPSRLAWPTIAPDASVLVACNQSR